MSPCHAVPDDGNAKTCGPFSANLSLTHKYVEVPRPAAGNFGLLPEYEARQITSTSDAVGRGANQHFIFDRFGPKL